MNDEQFERTPLERKVAEFINTVEDTLQAPFLIEWGEHQPRPTVAPATPTGFWVEPADERQDDWLHTIFNG